MNILTIGTFDQFHHGHVEFLVACREMSQHLTVGLNTRQFVQQYKGTVPDYIDNRIEHVAPYADEVMLHAGNTELFIDAWRRGVNYPRALAIGADWHGRDYLGQLGTTWQWLRKHGIILLYVHTFNFHHAHGVPDGTASFD